MLSPGRGRPRACAGPFPRTCEIARRRGTAFRAPVRVPVGSRASCGRPAGPYATRPGPGSAPATPARRGGSGPGTHRVRGGRAERPGAPSSAQRRGRGREGGPSSPALSRAGSGPERAGAAPGPGPPARALRSLNPFQVQSGPAETRLQEGSGAHWRRVPVHTWRGASYGLDPAAPRGC